MTYIVFTVYFVLINIIGYFAMWLDKRRAIKNRRRIPERTLMSIAIFFGSLGIILGMRAFNHKTKVPRFNVGVPLIFSAQLIAAIYMLII